MDFRAIGGMISSDGTLLGIGIFLTVIVGIAWVMSNRAEATPNTDQLAEMRHYVNNHFAQYVARGLAAEGTSNVAVSQDRAWEKVYFQQLRLHNELYQFAPRAYGRTQNFWVYGLAFLFTGLIGPIVIYIARRFQIPPTARQVFRSDIDQAVARELAAMRAVGVGSA